MKTNMILRVNQDLCTGCGRCTEICPRQAISLSSGVAQIDQIRCHNCGLCLDVCPQGAITELIPVSEHDLQENIARLKSITDNLISRIDKLEKRSEVK